MHTYKLARYNLHCVVLHKQHLLIVLLFLNHGKKGHDSM